MAGEENSIGKLGSKSGPYCVILDRLSGQYREIWTGLGFRGLASCLTTVTYRVIHHYKLQERCMNDPKQIEQNYDDSLLFNMQTGLLRASCSHQQGIEE